MNYFQIFRIKKLLQEIGILGGGSLFMWKIFWSKRRIIGIDLNPNAKKYMGLKFLLVTSQILIFHLKNSWKNRYNFR